MGNNKIINKRVLNNKITNKNVFTDEDYNSNDGMLTYVWGPTLWHSFHTISFNYPVNPTEKDKENYKLWFVSHKYTLPCKYCRDNFRNNLKKFPLTKKWLKNREMFSRYIYEFHEIVNKHLGKKSNLTYDQVRNRYENFRSRCINKKKGCTNPLYGKKSQCVISIIPKKKCQSLKIDPKCELKKF